MKKRTRIGIAVAGVAIAAFVGNQAAAALDNVQSSVQGGMPQGARTVGVPDDIQTATASSGIVFGMPDEIQT